MHADRRSPLPRIEAVAFDLGGVLIDWDARYLYRSILSDDRAIESFFEETGFWEWNLALDAGRDWDEAIEWLASRHPERRELIEAFRDRWEETVGGEIREVVEILRELAGAGIRTFALSNWSRRTFDIARTRFGFLDHFEGIVISADEGVTKPDERIYRILLDRFGLRPESTAFIDDRAENVDAASRLGIAGILFVEADSLRADLRALGLPLADAVGPLA